MPVIEHSEIIHRQRWGAALALLILATALLLSQHWGMMFSNADDPWVARADLVAIQKTASEQGRFWLIPLNFISGLPYKVGGWARNWLQTNCNCACTYNCNYGNTTYNCNCACNCQCDCLFSDDRLKINHGPIDGALDKVNALTGFYYTGNNTADHLGLPTGRDVGVSAQAVKQHLPEALGGNIAGTYMSVRYERLVPLLIEAVKELSRLVNANTTGRSK